MVNQIRDDKPAKDSGFKNIFALGSVSFFNDISGEMCFGLLPAFILKELRGTIGILGLIEGLAEALSHVSRVLSGFVSDYFRRRKPLVSIGYGISTVAKPLLAVAHSWIDALAIRLGDGAGKGIRTPPRDALLSESISRERMGIAFGLHRALDQLGAIIGPFLATGLMLFFMLSIRDIFWISFIPGLSALLILIAFVKEHRADPKEASMLSGIKEVLRGKFILLLLIIGIFSLGAFNFSFILVKAGELGVREALIPIVYSMINVAHTAIAIPVGALSDKLGKEKTLCLGYCVFLISTLLLLLHGEPIFAFIIALIYGVHDGTIETIQRAIIPHYVPSSLRATGYGVYYLVAGLCFLVANVVVGSLWEHFGIKAAVTYSAITTIMAIAGMFIFIKKCKA